MTAKSPGPQPRQPSTHDHLEELLDEADAESFPASDPPAVTPRREPVTKPPVPPQADEKRDPAP